MICFLDNGFWHAAQEGCFYSMSAAEAAAQTPGLRFARNTTLHFPSISRCVPDPVLCSVTPSVPHIWQSSWGAEQSRAASSSQPLGCAGAAVTVDGAQSNQLGCRSRVGSTALFIMPHRCVRESGRAGAAPLAPHLLCKASSAPPYPWFQQIHHSQSEGYKVLSNLEALPSPIRISKANALDMR